MKKFIFLFALVLFLNVSVTQAQCSICSKNAMQMGSKPAEGLNTGILFLMAAPYAVIGFVGYRWYKSKNKAVDIQDGRH